MPLVRDESVDSYLDALERLLYATSGPSVFDVDIGGIEEAFSRIWNDIEHGYYRVESSDSVPIPSLAELEARFAEEEGSRSVGFIFELGYRSPSLLQRIGHWVSSHRCFVVGLCIGLVWLAYRRRRRVGYLSRKVRKQLVKGSETESSSSKKPTIFVLGGEHPLATPLVERLTTVGFAVLSDSTLDAFRRTTAYPNAVGPSFFSESADDSDLFKQHLDSFVKAKAQRPDQYAFPFHSVISLAHLPPYVDNVSTIPQEQPSAISSEKSLFKLPSASSYMSYLEHRSVLPLRRLFDLVDILFTSHQSTEGTEPYAFVRSSTKNIIVCVPGIAPPSSVTGSPDERILEKISVASTLEVVKELRSTMSTKEAFEYFGRTKTTSISVDLDLSDPSSIPKEDVDKFVEFVTRTVSSGLSRRCSNRYMSIRSGRGCLGCPQTFGLGIYMLPVMLLDWWRGGQLHVGPSRRRQIKALIKSFASTCQMYTKGLIVYVAKSMITGLRRILETFDDNHEVMSETTLREKKGEKEEEDLSASLENSDSGNKPAIVPYLAMDDINVPDSNMQHFVTPISQPPLSPPQFTEMSSMSESIAGADIPSHAFFSDKSGIKPVYDEHAESGSVSMQLTSSIERLRAMSRTLTGISGFQGGLDEVPAPSDYMSTTAVSEHDDSDDNEGTEVASSWVSLTNAEGVNHA